MFDVTSSFKSETQNRMIEPVRRFYMSNSDYSDYVQKWPKIKRNSSELKAISLTVNLANTDGSMNEFYKGQYKLKDEIKFTLGVPDVEIDYSEVFSDYAFSEVTRGITSLDYIKLTESVNSDYHYIVDYFNGLEQNTDLYYDIKLKASEKNGAYIYFNYDTVWAGVRIYLDNGSYYNNNSSYIFSTIVESEVSGIGDWFWRTTVGIKFSDVTSVRAIIYLVNSNGNIAYDGDGTSGIWAGDATLKGTEAIDLYTGEINKISYTENDCVIKTRDKMWDFAKKVVGESNNQVKIPPTSQYLISDIAWTLCTCYGELDSTQDSSNPDIDYEAFAEWAEQFSVDNVFAQTNYDGTKIISALTSLARMSDSSIWIEGNGKLCFKKFLEAGSECEVFMNDRMGNLCVDIDMDRLVNKHWVYFDYSTDSDYWQSGVINVHSTSVNTFGLHEEVLKEESIWYVTSVSALSIAARKGERYHYPNRKFKFNTGLFGIYTQIGDTVRLVNSFYDLTSGQGWTVDAVTYDMDKLKNEYRMDESLVLDAFFLDVSTLDGDKLLL